ncbi:amidohydrolase family protein [Flagellimonas marina]|uniref:Amidohydrolase family protein n=1 Tax=Flagellimonas marina TaxID=1775168 RepID=A0ABV8PQB3_9FLAO
MKNYHTLLLIILSLVLTQCKENKDKKQNATEAEVVKSYGVDDFKTLPKIDVHVHINTLNSHMIDLTRANNFKLLNIAVDYPGSPLSIEEKQEISREHAKNHPDVFAFGSTFSLEGWDDPDWSDKVIAKLKRDFDKGANSIKTWKNIGMDFRDKNGDLVFLDHPKFDPVFDFLKSEGKVWMSHAGEPLNCWLPLDSMTVNNDRKYFRANPKYHMYLHPDLPSYQEQIDHRDNRAAKNPDLSLVAVHMASLEWSVDETAKFLDRFPNATVDLAERMSHTQYQSQRDREKVRDFFIKYQDRVLYGTDFGESDKTDPEELEAYMKEVWENDWKYFNTDQMISVPQLDTPVQGLALPKEVVDKIYYLNAKRVFPNAWE